MNEPTENIKPRSGRSIKKFLRLLSIIILILVLGIFSFLYFGIYDEGVRAGVVVRVSKKGVFFKTYEGQLNMETFGALKKNTPFMQSFDFSIEKSRKDVIKDLEQASLTGERVNLHYIKRYIKIPWRGNTKYFIEEVETLERSPKEENMKETDPVPEQNVN